MCGVDSRQKFRHPEVVGVGGAGHQRGLAGRPPAFDASNRQIYIAQDTLRFIEQDLAGLGKHESTSRSVEQQDVVFLLDLLDGNADG
jgi:hypothetical protein